MPARKPQTPKTRDQLVAHETDTDRGKDRMIDQLARTGIDVGGRVGQLEADVAALTTAPKVTGSRASGAALASLLSTLATLGIITDKTTA